VIILVVLLILGRRGAEPEEEPDEILIPVSTADVPEEFKRPLDEDDLEGEDEEEEMDDANATITEEPYLGKPEEASKPEGAAPETKPAPPQPKPAVPVPSPTAPEPSAADKQRIARCEKMLAVASVLPEDRERLRLLIPSGINPHDFTEEVKMAIEKKKKKDAEKKLSANEKAAMLEEELAAELAELENALDKKDDDEMEEKILKEIEDLENL
jgi:hypothetical protein